MDNGEMIKNFGDMVNAAEKLSSPWKKTCYALIGALVAVSLILGCIIFYLVHCAYMDPVEFDQEQDFSQQSQSQSYNSGATNGG